MEMWSLLYQFTRLPYRLLEVPLRFHKQGTNRDMTSSLLTPQSTFFISFFFQFLLSIHTITPSLLCTVPGIPRVWSLTPGGCSYKSQHLCSLSCALLQFPVTVPFLMCTDPILRVGAFSSVCCSSSQSQCPLWELAALWIPRVRPLSCLLLCQFPVSLTSVNIWLVSFVFVIKFSIVLKFPYHWWFYFSFWVCETLTWSKKVWTPPKIIIKNDFPSTHISCLSHSFHDRSYRCLISACSLSCFCLSSLSWVDTCIFYFSHRYMCIFLFFSIIPSFLHNR